jgi:hypothetical protein
MDPAQRLDAIDDALRHHQPLAKLERQQDRSSEADRAVLVPRLDGSGQLLADLGAESFTTVAHALEAEADLPEADPPPGDRPDGLPRLQREGPSTRSAKLGDALVRLASRALGAEGGVGLPTRFTVAIDLDRVTDRLAGLLEPALAARPPRIVRRALDRLACDAALDLVLTRGHRPLAAKRYAPEVPAATRRAVLARRGRHWTTYPRRLHQLPPPRPDRPNGPARAGPAAPPGPDGGLPPAGDVPRDAPDLPF